MSPIRQPLYLQSYPIYIVVMLEEDVYSRILKWNFSLIPQYWLVPGPDYYLLSESNFFKVAYN